MARLRVSDPVFPPDALADGLAEVASSRLLGARVIEEIVRSNVELHGLVAVDRAAERAIAAVHPDERAAAKLATAVARCMEARGQIIRPLELLDHAGCALVSPRWFARLSRQARLLTDGIAISDPGQPSYDPVPDRVIYSVAQSLPHHSSGYSIRTHWLVRHLRARGWDISVHARFGYPNDRYDFIGVGLAGNSARFDDVTYHFEPNRRGYDALDIEAYHSLCVPDLVRRAGAMRPALIHCASNYAVGLAGVEAARRLGIPSIYEVRGLWHMTRAAGQPEYLGSDHYRLIESLEVRAAAAADRVLVITEAIGDVLRGHGVAPDKITVVPNAVDCKRFTRSERDDDLARTWNVAGSTVIGYIGSFKRYEGLDDLLRAVAALRSRIGARFRVLLVGDGEAQDELMSLAQNLGLDDLVVFTGRQPHDQVLGFYSLVDVMAFPRKDLPLCEVVAPLKPFEAMATGTAVVASSVGALAEMVDHETTGLVFQKGDVSDLSVQLERLVTRPELRAELANTARQWVIEQRSWATISDRVAAVYRDLGAGG